MQTQRFTTDTAGSVPSRMLDSGMLTFYIDRILEKLLSMFRDYLETWLWGIAESLMLFEDLCLCWFRC